MKRLKEEDDFGIAALAQEKVIRNKKFFFNKKELILDGFSDIKVYPESEFQELKQEACKYLYLLARSIKAKKIVEFGCSSWISTLYLAAAAKDNCGSLITSEIEPAKVNEARKRIIKAGLLYYTTILSGDAMKTLSNFDGDIDFLFLSGANELYLPLFEMLYPRLCQKSIIVANNANSPVTSPYVEYICKYKNEFNSVKLLNNRVLVSFRN